VQRDEGVMMIRKIATNMVLLLALALPYAAFAEVGVTDDCQKDIRDLKERIAKDKDDYTAESRTKANAELALAQTNRLNPIKCRKNIQDARSELRQGKKDKKERKDD
jgi:hypothetical protein